jgi:hypothetical protein
MHLSIREHQNQNIVNVTALESVCNAVGPLCCLPTPLFPEDKVIVTLETNN